ncbi:MAG: hypothetical protein RLZZ156_1691 [Deinococcota bacterium]
MREQLKQANWNDSRNADTVAWMVTGLLESKTSNPSQWVSYVQSKASFAQSTEVRFNRLLENGNIKVEEIYRPIIISALKTLAGTAITLSLDTSMLFKSYCMIKIVLLYRGRGVTIAWEVIEHASAAVSLKQFLTILDEAKLILIKAGIKDVTLLADRGFADTSLMQYLNALGWTYIIRIKASFGIFSPAGDLLCKTGEVALACNQSKHYHNVYLTQNHFAIVHVGLARVKGAKEPWFIVSNIPTTDLSFIRYGMRFDIEQVFKDDKSGGFNLESSDLRSADTLNRLMLVLCLAMLFLVAEGTRVVLCGFRRMVDCHWQRGLSYLQLGWRFIARALTLGLPFLVSLALHPGDDPEPIPIKKLFVDLVAGLSSQTMAFRVLSSFV